MKKKNLIDKRIGILGKGGSGKSTVTVLLAKALSEKGKEVFVLDADSANIGLHQALGLKKLPVSLIDYFGGAVFSGGFVTCPVDDPTPLSGAEISLDKLPHKYYVQEKGISLLVAGKIGNKGPGAGCDGPISKIVRDLKIRKTKKEPGITLIDLKAGLEDTARGVITSLDWVITVVDPTSAAVQVALDIKNIVQQIKKGKLPATKHLEDPNLVEIANRMFREARIKDSLVVLNKVRDKKIENYLKKKLKTRGIRPIGVIRENPSIFLAWLEEKPLEGGIIREGVEKIIKKLEKIG